MTRHKAAADKLRQFIENAKGGREAYAAEIALDALLNRTRAIREIIIAEGVLGYALRRLQIRNVRSEILTFTNCALLVATTGIHPKRRLFFLCHPRFVYCRRCSLKDAPSLPMFSHANAAVIFQPEVDR